MRPKMSLAFVFLHPVHVTKNEFGLCFSSPGTNNNSIRAVRWQQCNVKFLTLFALTGFNPRASVYVAETTPPHYADRALRG
jgi:hypothetical protein